MKFDIGDKVIVNRVLEISRDVAPTLRSGRECGATGRICNTFKNLKMSGECEYVYHVKIEGTGTYMTYFLEDELMDIAEYENLYGKLPSADAIANWLKGAYD